MTEPVALNYLKQGLRSEDTAFVYHCYNHYFCPVGYEMTPHVSHLFFVDAVVSE